MARFNWVKKGLIFEPGQFDWLKSHGQNPFPEHVEGDVFRIHFAGRDDQNRARGGFVEIDINEPKKVLYLTEAPTIDLGELGCFDDCGAMPSCIVDFDGKKYMYYTGWTQARATPFSFFIGLLISEDGGRTYRRYSKAPVLGRSFHDPFLTCSPWVIRERGKWRMWYVSGTGWGGSYQFKDVDNAPVKMKHFYHIKYAESDDGVNWRNDGRICIDYQNEDEYAIARPTVYKEDGLYKMWYTYRGGSDTYRAGYAESVDGLDWERKDAQVGIEPTDSFDKEMICYPCLFDHRGTKYLLYNGNNYGANGICLAVNE